jgi:hypothetical protein
VKKMDKVDGPDVDKSKWIKLEFLMDPENPALGSKYSQQFPYFRKNRPPHFFCFLGKKMDKVDGPDADKSEWIKLEFLMDTDNPA